jgi:NTP pyrophosphatase (non-canonical NTP hydrolase)
MITDINDIAESCGIDSRDWFPDTASNPTFLILAACGEVGELANLQKKVERGTHAPDDVEEQMCDEAMDAIIYLLCFLDYEGQDVAALYAKIREKNVKRFANQSAGVPAATSPGGC